MNYQQLRDYALQCSIEHHLCNVEDLLDDNVTLGEMLELVENGSDKVVIWEPYEYHEPESVVESIEDMRGVKLHEFLDVLGKVNGEEWLENFKKAEA